MNNLYAKLALLLAGAFVVVSAALMMATQTMFDRERLIELAVFVMIASVAFALLAALCVYQLFTRRLGRLASAVDTFAHDGFTTPLRVPGIDPNGDEIDRLSTHVERMSERIVRQLEQLQDTDVWRRELLANVSHDSAHPAGFDARLSRDAAAEAWHAWHRTSSAATLKSRRDIASV